MLYGEFAGWEAESSRITKKVGEMQRVSPFALLRQTRTLRLNGVLETAGREPPLGKFLSTRQPIIADAGATALCQGNLLR